MLLNMTSMTPLADAIKNQIHRKRMNYSIIITGRPQLRKSTIAIALALGINPKFSFEKDLAIIKAKEYMNVLDMKEKRGAVKVLDEFGVGMNHRQWYSFLNQAMSYIMQTHGYEGKVIIVTAPYEDYVDVDAKKLFDMLIEMKKKNDGEGYATAVINVLDYNQKLKKIYYHLLRGRFPDGVVKRITAFRIRYPPKEIMDNYFALAESSKEGLKGELTREATSIERRKVVFDPNTYIEEIKSEPQKFVKEFHHHKIISREMIMNAFPGIGDTRAKQIKIVAEEKLRIELGLGDVFERAGKDTNADGNHGDDVEDNQPAE